jgi:hypothetical protein
MVPPSGRIAPLRLATNEEGDMNIPLFFIAGAVSVLISPAAPHLDAQDSPRATPPVQSTCIACHTDVKGLIRLSWEVEKIRPKQAQSAETSGEG